MKQAAIAHLRNDPILSELIDRIGPIRCGPRRLPTFKSLVHAVIHQQLSGPEHPDVAISLNNLAILYRATGRSSEAEKLEARAKGIQEIKR